MAADPPGDQRVALVMAASKGIGRGCAESLAAAGFRVAVCARSADGVDDTVGALRALGAEAEGVAADVSHAEGVASVFELADRAFGRLDVLVANAGGPPPGEFLTVDEDDWDAAYQLTFMSAVRAMRQAVPRMRAAGYGRILVIGSSSVRQPLPNLALSNAFRPALAGVVKTAAVELAADGITVNMILPGRIDTDRVRAVDEATAGRRGVSRQEARAASEASIPMGRYGTLAEIGALAAFLASESASYITGQTVLVDGGLVPTLP